MSKQPSHTRSPVTSSLSLSGHLSPPGLVAPGPSRFVTDSRPADFNQDDSGHGALAPLDAPLDTHHIATGLKLASPQLSAPAAAASAVRFSASFSIEGEASQFTVSHDEPYQRGLGSSGILTDRLTVTIDRPGTRLPQPIGRAPEEERLWLTPPSMALPLPHVCADEVEGLEGATESGARPATPLVPVILTAAREDVLRETLEEQQESSATHPAPALGPLGSNVSTSTIPLGAHHLGPRPITTEPDCISHPGVAASVATRGVGTDTTPDPSNTSRNASFSAAVPSAQTQAARRHKPLVLSKKVQIDDRNIFINGLTPDIDDAKLKEMFGAFGEIQSSRVLVNSRTGRHKGIGFVFYRDAESARRAIEAMNDLKVRDSGWSLVVKYADEAAAFAPELSNKLFIRNVPNHVSSSTLKEFFARYGEVADCHVRPDVSSQGRREGSALQMAYVTYKSIDEASDALSATHATSPFGANLPLLQVKFAETLECRNQRKQRSGQPQLTGTPPAATSMNDDRMDRRHFDMIDAGVQRVPTSASRPTLAPIPPFHHADPNVSTFIGRPQLLPDPGSYVGPNLHTSPQGLPVYSFSGQPQQQSMHPVAQPQPQPLPSPPPNVGLQVGPSLPIGYTSYAMPTPVPTQFPGAASALSPGMQQQMQQHMPPQHQMQQHLPPQQQMQQHMPPQQQMQHHLSPQHQMQQQQHMPAAYQQQMQPYGSQMQVQQWVGRQPYPQQPQYSIPMGAQSYGHGMPAGTMQAGGPVFAPPTMASPMPAAPTSYPPQVLASQGTSAYPGGYTGALPTTHLPQSSMAPPSSSIYFRWVQGPN